MDNFTDFSLANALMEDRGYLVKLSPFIEDGPLYNVYALYKGFTSSLLINTLTYQPSGEMISENFVTPDALTVEDITVSNISHNSFTLTLPRGNQFVRGVTVKFQDLPISTDDMTNTTVPVVRHTTFLYPPTTGDEVSSDIYHILGYR